MVTGKKSEAPETLRDAYPEELLPVTKKTKRP